MKCPYCAETIQDEAVKCRYCGEALTIADKKGYPRFYKNISEWAGLDFEALLMDYGQHLFPGEGLMDCYLSAQNALGNIWNYTFGDIEAMTLEYKRVWSLMDAIGRRMGDIKDKNNAEWRFLDVCLGYIIETSFLVNPKLVDSWNDRRNLESMLDRFRKLLSKLPGLPEESRPQFENYFQHAIGELQTRLQ